MAGSLRAVVGQLSIVRGVRRQRADNILVVESDGDLALGRAKAQLYALIELSGLVSPPPHLRRELQEIVKQEFLHAAGSLAATLEQAIKRVNQHLYEYNRVSPREKRQGGGVTFVALRGNELFIAQGGPAVAYLVQDDQVKRYPEYSPWFDESVDAADGGPPRFLGASRQISVDLAHCQIRPGDCFVLAESLLGQIAAPHQVGAALACSEVHTAAERLADLVGGEDISLAVIQAEPQETMPVMSGASTSRHSAFDGPLPLARRQRPEPSRRGQLKKHAPARMHGSAVTDRLRRVDWACFVQLAEKWLAVIFSFLLMTLKFVGRNAKVLLLRTLPGEAGEEARRRRGKAKPKAEGPPTDERRELLNLAKIRVILKHAAFVIPLLIIAIAAIVFYEKDRATRETYNELIQAAQANEEKALAQMADVSQARALLSTAMRAVEEAAAISPEAPELVQLRKDISDKLDQVNQVKRLYWVPLLRQYTAQGVDLRRIIVDGINVYVLDRGKNQVYKHTLNETNDGFQEKDNPVIVKQGDQVEDVVVDELLDIAWVPAGGGRQTSNLVILDKKGHLFDYSPTFGVKHKPLADTDKWMFPQAVCGFYGNLYVLDPHLNQILKYQPTSDGGYSNSPGNYLTGKAQVDLTGAVNMAIDGAIYVLYANGRIAKFMNGDPIPFEITGLELPMSNPSAIFTDSDESTQYLYVADAGNHRIIQLAKGGHFQRQFKVETDAFDDLRSLWVDELEQKMYIASGNSVYVTNLVAD